MNHVVKKQQGFTLIEMMLAMAFVAMLLLAIALTIVQIANIYNRGSILREINVNSRSIGDELDSAFRSSSSFSLLPSDNRYVSKAWGGRLCLGQYSYIWNYGTALAQQDTNRNQYSAPNTNDNVYKDANGTVRYEMSFVKVPDAGATYCVPNGQGKYPNISPTGAIELLKLGDHNLVLHDFAVVSSATSVDSLSGQQLYKLSYSIGTSDLTALDLTKTPYVCKAPSVAGADLNYCSIQQFTIVLRVVSGVN
jgi:prepilin-type N-terminal cleavage/methylation domain-containing protein